MKVVISNGQLAPPATPTTGGEVDDATVGVDVEESEVKVEVEVGANVEVEVDIDVEVVVVVVTMVDVVCGIVFVDIVVVVVVVSHCSRLGCLGPDSLLQCLAPVSRMVQVREVWL